MKFGALPKGINQEQVTETLHTHAQPGEEFLFACKATVGFKTEILGISNVGLIVLSSKDLGSVSKRANLVDVNKFKASWTGLEVGISGQSSNWILGLDKADSQEIQTLNPLKDLVAIKDVSDLPTDGKKLTLSEKIEKKISEQELSREKNSQREQDKRNEGYTRDQRERFGNVLIIEKFARKKIKIFENGYVSIDGKSPEKLVSADGSADVTKKTGPGRAIGGIAAIATGQILLAGSSNNRRGDVYLTLNTEAEVYALSIDLKNTHSEENPVEVMNKILATCKRVIAVNDVSNMQPNQVPVGPDLATQISSLNDLFQSGVLSEEEFNAAKAKILGA